MTEGVTHTQTSVITGIVFTKFRDTYGMLFLETLQHALHYILVKIWPLGGLIHSAQSDVKALSNFKTIHHCSASLHNFTW